MRHALGIPALTKSRLGKNHSYEVLTQDRRYATIKLEDYGQKGFNKYVILATPSNFVCFKDGFIYFDKSVT